ncbi:MAG: AAA family ATPase, partial [Acidobacteriota bacterium]
MIVGLTGRNCSGKGEAVEFLKAKGFYSHSLSDVIRDEIGERGLEVTRENLIRVGNELRSRHGHGVLAQRILDRLEPDRNYVIDSIRHPAEAEALSGRSDFVLLAVQASPRLRFERIRKRARQGDPRTFEEFQRTEEKELGNSGSERQQLDSLEGLASHRVQNEATLAEFHNRLSVLLRQQMSRMGRPGWDEYFMRIAKVASLRSNCVKRKVAA